MDVRIYRWGWAVTWSTVAAVPVFLGLLVAPSVAILCAAVLVTACRAAIARCSVAGCVRTGLGTTALVAMLGSLGPAGLGVGALAGATWPTAGGGLGRAVRGGGARPADVRTIDDARLWAAWSESYRALQRARTPAERLAIVDARQAYLDELEARDAVGFRNWLSSGARPTVNPGP